MNRGCIAEIDLKALSNNFRVVKSLSRNLPVIAAVKADAYGHGAIEVAKRLVKDGVEYLAVAFTEEARELREASIKIPILVFFDPDIDDIIKYSLVPVISDKKTAIAISARAGKLNISVDIHVKIDTGMGRMGINDNYVEEIAEIAALKGVNIGGVMSHFSEADLPDASFAQMQLDKFRAVKAGLSERGLKIKLFHLAYSAAIMTIPESHFDAVRPGLMLYGYSPLSQSFDLTSYPLNLSTPASLLPVMSVKTRIISLRRLPAGSPVSYGRTFVTKRDSLIGVIAAGYADGFSRRFTNNAEVLVRGKKVPVAGRVCMDLTMIDVTDLDQVSEGDEVVIIGRQGDEQIDACVLANKADTIPYEILTSLGRMSKKIYK